MNYIKQLNAFYKIVPIKQISPNAKNLYETLMYINSSCYWKSDFTVANLYLMTLTGLNKQAIYRARNELIQKELIEFKKGINQNEAGRYTIVEFVTADDTAYVTADDTPNDTPNDTADDTADDTINKQNKTKQKRKNIKKEFVPPTFEEIERYVLEKKLKVNAKKFYDYFTEGDWIDSKGNRVKNWKQKILTWNGYVNTGQKMVSNIDQRSYSDADFESLYVNKGE